MCGMRGAVPRASRAKARLPAARALASHLSAIARLPSPCPVPRDAQEWVEPRAAPWRGVGTERGPSGAWDSARPELPRGSTPRHPSSRRHEAKGPKRRSGGRWVCDPSPRTWKAMSFPFPPCKCLEPQNSEAPHNKEPTMPPPTPKAEGKDGDALGHSKGTRKQARGCGHIPTRSPGKRGDGERVARRPGERGDVESLPWRREGHWGSHRVSARVLLREGAAPARRPAGYPPPLRPPPTRPPPPRESPQGRSARSAGAGGSSASGRPRPPWPRETRMGLGHLGHHPRPPTGFFAWVGGGDLSLGAPLRGTWLETGQGP